MVRSVGLAALAYKVLSHTADTGVEATAPSLAGLIDELATAMFELIAHVTPCPQEVSVEVEVNAPTPEDLVLEVLSEFLYESEAQDLMLCGFETTMLAPTHARVTAGGVDILRIEVTGPPIKAVTYHRLLVEEREDDWRARVYFDV